MGHRCCNKQKVKRGLWSPEEDEKLVKQITIHGHASWSSVPKLAGLQRCGKSCRLRWINYLRPDLKRGSFTADEEQIIIDVHRILGNRWAQIAKHLPGRTDNEVKNFWNSCIKKKLMAHGLDPKTHNLMRPTKSNMISNNHQKQQQQQPKSVFSIMESQVTNSPSDYQSIVTPPFNNINQPEFFQNVEKFTINDYQNTSTNYNIAQNFNAVSTCTFPNYGPTLLEDHNITPSKLSHYLDDVCLWDANFDTIQAPIMELEDQSFVQKQQVTEKGGEGSYCCNDQNNKGASFQGSSSCNFDFGLMESIMSEVMYNDRILTSVDDLVWKY